MSDLQAWAEWFGISLKEVNRWCAAGIIPASRGSSRQHWRAPCTVEAKQTAFNRLVLKYGWETSNVKLLRPLRNASRFLESPIHIVKRAKVYAIAAGIDRAVKRERIEDGEMDRFRYVTRHWLKHKNPEAEKRECLAADPAYLKLFPSQETYDYACKNPKQAELVVAFMLAINAHAAGEMKNLHISAVRNEWQTVIGLKPTHGQPGYSANEYGWIELHLANSSPAAFYRRFSKRDISHAHKEALRMLNRDSTKFEGMAGDSKSIALIFDEASNQPAKPTARKFPNFTE